jgi:hypothetical protein
MKSQFKCDCKTSRMAIAFLEGTSTEEDLRLAILHHENHACPDFMSAVKLLCDAVKKRKGETR